jgi:SAM-dependent methyltransferase
MDRFQNTGLPDRDWWSTLWPEPGETLRAVGIDGCDSLVDVCCGDGYFTVPAAAQVDGPVYAVDLDADCLSRTEREASAADQDVQTLQGDVRELATLLPEPVSCALIANTFHGVENPTAFSETVAECLSPGGRFVVVNWHERPREETTVDGVARGPPTDLRQSPAATRSVVEPAGFDHVETVDLPPYHYGAVFERR